MSVSGVAPEGELVGRGRPIQHKTADDEVRRPSKKGESAAAHTPSAVIWEITDAVGAPADTNNQRVLTTNRGRH